MLTPPWRFCPSAAKPKPAGRPAATPAAKPAAKPEAKPASAGKPALKPQSAAEQALTRNESLVKREVEAEQAAEQKAAAKKAEGKQVRDGDALLDPASEIILQILNGTRNAASRVKKGQQRTYGCVAARCNQNPKP